MKKVEFQDNTLVEMISSAKGYDCSFIKNTDEFKKLKSFLLNLTRNKKIEITKINRNFYKCNDYLLKIKNNNNPSYIIKSNSIVNVYYKKQFKIRVNNRIYSFAFEIQDYIYPNEMPSIEDLYQLYTELKEEGYIWLDVKEDNAVKQNKKSIIIDTDYIFKEDDINIDNYKKIETQLSKIFSNIYNLKQNYNL